MISFGVGPYEPQAVTKHRFQAQISKLTDLLSEVHAMIYGQIPLHRDRDKVPDPENMLERSRVLQYYMSFLDGDVTNNMCPPIDRRA